MFEKHFDSTRYIYNVVLERKINAYRNEGISIGENEMCKQIGILRTEIEWLKDVYPNTLKFAIKSAYSAFTYCGRNISEFPQFKTKKDLKRTFSFEAFTINFEKGVIKVSPLVGGEIKTVFSRIFEDTRGYRSRKRITISRTTTGKYFASLLIDDGKELPTSEPYDQDTTMGIDVGLKHFITLSNGEKVENPRFLKNSLTRLKVLQRRNCKKQIGSKNRKKSRRQVAKLHEKIANQRSDFQHKLSAQLISENQALAVENLNVEGLKQNHKFSQAVSDAAWFTFTYMLRYKAKWYGKTVIAIGRFEPSTKTCSNCGYYYKDITLGIRKWQCPECGAMHDRDINAAINIKNFALKITPGDTGEGLADSRTKVQGMNQEVTS